MYNGRLAMDFYGHENPITGKDGRIRPSRYRNLTASIGVDFDELRDLREWAITGHVPLKKHSKQASCECGHMPSKRRLRQTARYEKKQSKDQPSDKEKFADGRGISRSGD